MRRLRLHKGTPPMADSSFQPRLLYKIESGLQGGSLQSGDGLPVVGDPVQNVISPGPHSVYTLLHMPYIVRYTSWWKFPINIPCTLTVYIPCTTPSTPENTPPAIWATLILIRAPVGVWLHPWPESPRVDIQSLPQSWRSGLCCDDVRLSENVITPIFE
jgi:hypothetical protein